MILILGCNTKTDNCNEQVSEQSNKHLGLSFKTTKDEFSKYYVDHKDYNQNGKRIFEATTYATDKDYSADRIGTIELVDNDGCLESATLTLFYPKHANILTSNDRNVTDIATNLSLVHAAKFIQYKNILFPAEVDNHSLGTAEITKAHMDMVLLSGLQNVEGNHYFMYRGPISVHFESKPKQEIIVITATPAVN